MSRINYKAKLDERVDELRRLYGISAEPKGPNHIDWKRESGSYVLYIVVNRSGGISVIRHASNASELLDYIEGVIDGTKVLILHKAQRERDEKGELYERFMNS